MTFLRYLREMSPFRQLLLASLVMVVVFQVVAMAMLVQSQVEKAAARDTLERAAVAQRQMSAPRDDTVLANGVMTVGYAPQR